jgi:Sec-independent protein translocase protein TatA
MAAIGLKEILVVGVVVLLLFGTSLGPKLARRGGKQLRESRDSLVQSKQELEAGLRDHETEAAATTTAPPRSTVSR